MLIVKVDDAGIDKALKIMKNKVRRTKLVQELRAREAFDKPSVKKRSTKLKAIYVQQKFGTEDGQE